MAGESEVNVIDLPEPRRVVTTPADKPRRQWNLVLAFLWLTALYAGLHKGLVPFVLGFTALSGSPYAQLSPWFLHPLLLAVLASRAQKLSATTSLLSGAGITHGALEVLAVVQGQAVGWLVFSRLLAAVPFAIVCIALLTGPFPGRDSRAAWMGAAIVGVFPLAAYFLGGS